MAKNLFIGNLSYGTSETKLRDAFSKYGPTAVRVVEGRGFGFVEVGEDQASTAISEMNDSEVDGRKIIVSEARPREERPRNNYGGGGSYGGSGGGRSKSGRGSRW